MQMMRRLNMKKKMIYKVIKQVIYTNIRRMEDMLTREVIFLRLNRISYLISYQIYTMIIFMMKILCL
jgi:hypothetical protein